MKVSFYFHSMGEAVCARSPCRSYCIGLFSLTLIRKSGFSRHVDGVKESFSFRQRGQPVCARHACRFWCVGLVSAVFFMFLAMHFGIVEHGVGLHT